MRKLVVVGVSCLVVGLLVGWYSGRYALERYWTQPLVLKRLAATDVERSSGAGADPVPGIGTRVLRPAPLALARAALAEMTRQDPLILSVGNVKTGEPSQLKLDLTNRGKCAITSFSGVAYGYDAYGRPSPLNKGGEHYVAFSEKDVTNLEPSRTHQLAMKLHHSRTASLALAHVDQVTCADGARWVRN
ncbi:MAG TPA: hypothetical protein VFK05_14110 [Polyangiaceae bacterium]|nr:hypothetical protein [Polyangiaceae bacterium]